jgi:hypothetical protein
MTRINYFIFLFLIQFSLYFAQTGKPGATLTYGNLIYKNNFLDQTHTVDNKNWQLPTRFIGLHLTDYIIVINPRMQTYVGCGMNYFLATELAMDSLKPKFSGTVFSLDLGKIMFQGVKHFRLFIYSGFTTGNYMLKSGNTVYKNPFFSPKITITPKVYFGRFYIGISGGYNRDISKVHWIRKKGDSYNISGWDQSCYNFQVLIGITHG